MRTWQLPCHCPFWDDDMPKCHVDILHNQSFWKWLAFCLPIHYSEHCQNTNHVKTLSSGILGVWPAFSFHVNQSFRCQQIVVNTILASSWLNSLLNMHTSSRMPLLTDSTLLWSDCRILMRSPLFNFSKAYLV